MHSTAHAAAPLEKVPAPLRGIRAAELAGADPHVLQAALQRFVESSLDDHRLIRSAITYPLVVTMLAGVGVAWLWTQEVPPLERFETSFIPLVPTPPPGPMVERWLWQPAAFGIAVGIAAAAATWFIAARRWKPAGSRAALVCNVRAALTAVNCPPADEARILADVCGEGDTKHHVPSCVPGPLAVQAAGIENPVERAEAFQAVADFYQTLDNSSRRERLRLLPIVSVAIAGFVVFLYGVALFGPLAESMQRMAESRPGLHRPSAVP